ncbi:MAG: hypothetical protein IJQ67_00750 [Bacilli bacterium]|nr:hypothetical protein [Methanobrevibacter sp.]MBQ6629743.1 hypothetical protein [Methanobrevibacter sp.]MBR0294419.1 hypothetical protein [Bacilli bacterium]
MNYNRYSIEWQDRLNPYLNAVQGRTWEDTVRYFHFYDEQRAKNENLVILSEGVWMEIDVLFSNSKKLRKIRGITKDDVYYDGDYKGIYNCLGLGSLSHVFRIDEHKIDLNDVPPNKRQDELLAFIKDNTGITDERLPPVPKGILKI